MDKLLNSIKENYDLNYGEVLINPREFYDLIEGAESGYVQKE